MLPLKLLDKKPSLLLAVMVKLKEPVPVGVPVKFKVFVLEPEVVVVIPAGRLPADTVHVTAVDVLTDKASE